MVLREGAVQASRHGGSPEWVVVIGANAGGPQALAAMLPQFPPSFPGTVIVVQQMRPGFTRVLVDQLSHTCHVPVYEPEDGHALQSGRILVAPSTSRLKVGNLGDDAAPAYSVLLENVAGAHELRYSRVDCAMESAAKLFGRRTIGILLSGVGTDGREGMRAISGAGGVTIAQDEATSVVHSLPLSAIEAGVVTHTLPLWNIADQVVDIVGGKTNAAAA
jgi:two-component system, chemotaxis family, protein-glutamate methylesterase/glutaminase